jgi:uncharacterized protein (TIGR00369 family)
MISANTPSWGVASLDTLKSMSGLEFLAAIRDGRLPSPPISRGLAFALVEVEQGRAVFEGSPGVDHYNPIGTVHGGYAATLLDSCMACAVQSTLPRGMGYTTLEFKVSLVRPITVGTGKVRAEGRVLASGRRIGTADGRLVDSAGKLLAHGTTTCMIMEL